LPALVIASITGTLSTDPNESGPITSLEQAMIGEAPAATRVRVFGRYNAIAYLTGAVGSLAAGGPAAFRHLFPGLPANQRFLLVFPVIAVIAATLAGRLTGAMEGSLADGKRSARREEAGRRSEPRRPLGSIGIIRRLAALFALDSFGGGFVVQSFLAFWFQRKFGASVATLGLVFFGAGLLQAASSVAAARLAGRIGLLNVMVFTHLPSNALLVAVPFAPNLTVAVVLLLCRFALSQMDVPTRQAYLATVVEPDERTPAAAYTNTARYASRPLGPVAGGALMQHVALAAPFVAAGGLKILYDVALYGLFRKLPLSAGEPSPSPSPRPSSPSPSSRRPSGERPSEEPDPETPAPDPRPVPPPPPPDPPPAQPPPPGPA